MRRRPAPSSGRNEEGSLKEPAKDPLLDQKSTFQDPKDPRFDQTTGTGVLDVVFPVDPRGPLINPAVRSAGVPFVMATPHHAPAHLVQQQASAVNAATAAAAAAPNVKSFPLDTTKEAGLDTFKEPVRDTLEELSFDTPKETPFNTFKEVSFETRKELIFETLVEGSPFDPGSLQQPIWNFPGLMF